MTKPFFVTMPSQILSFVINFIVGLFFVLFTSFANAAESYKIDPHHTSVVWLANHFGFSSVNGKFAEIEGDLLLDEKHPNKSKVNILVKTDNLFTGYSNFDNHLKSKDFFNVKEFPIANFVSKKIIITGKNTAKVIGDLTLLGIAKSITLDVKLNKIGINPIVNKKTVGFSANAIIKRSDFGLKYALPAISDEVKLNIEAEANLVE